MTKKEFLRLAVPLAGQGLFLNFAILVDLAMVGQLGIAGLAAVGICSQPKMVLSILYTALAVALTALVGRRYGEKNIEEAKRIFTTGMVMTLVMYTAFIVPAIIFAADIVKIAGAKSDYSAIAAAYFKWIAVSRFFDAISTVLAVPFMMTGRGKVIFFAGAVGNILNAGLNYIFIFGNCGAPAMGVAGAGLATMICAATTALILALRLQNTGLGFTNRLIKPLKMARLTVHAVSEQICERIGLFIFARLIADLGTVGTGTGYVTMIIEDIFYYIFIGMGQAEATLVSKSLGAHDVKQARQYIRTGLLFSLSVGVVGSFLFIAFGRSLAGLMMAEGEVLSLATRVLFVSGIALIPEAIAPINAGALRGAGDTSFVAKYSLIIIAVFRPIITYLFIYPWGFGLPGAWMAIACDQGLRALISAWRLHGNSWCQREI